MLVSMNAMRTYEMVSFYAKTNNKFMLVIDNTRWCFLDSTKQQEVMAYYDEIIDEDEIQEIFRQDYKFYEFDTQSAAIDKAIEWFPLSTQLDDQDYFIEAYVINPTGAIPHTSLVPPGRPVDSE